MLFPQFSVVIHFEIIFGTMWYDRTSSYHSSVAESPYICPRNSEPIWSGFRGLLCIGTSTVVGAPNFKKKEFIR